MKKAIYILMFLLFPVLAGAQALPFTATSYDPVSVAKGGTFLTETSSSAYAAFANPAAAPFAEKKLDAAAGFMMWQYGTMPSNILSAAGTYMLDDNMGVSLGFTYGMNQEYDIIDASGVTKGTFTPSDMQLNAAFSWRFLPYLSLGAAVGYASSSLAENVSYSAVNADIFAMARFKELKAAVGVKGLGTAVKSASGASFSLPMALAAGIGYELSGEGFSADVNVDAEYHIDGGVAVATGASCTFVKMMTLRMGYRYGGETVIPSFASLGCGFCFSNVSVDLACLLAAKNSPMAQTACLSVGYSF